MIKSVFAAVAAAPLFAGAAFAGPYVNIESNAGFVGNDYEGAVTETHVGYEGANWYVQGGPALIQPDGEDGSTELSGKAGGSFNLTEALSVYGEVSFVTGEDDNSYGTKVGAKFSF